MNDKSDTFSFENLIVYQKSLKLAVDLVGIASYFPVKFSKIRDQLIGAITSIPFNIAEGAGRKSKKDQVNFYKTARTSAFECIPIIDIAHQLKLVNASQKADYRQRIVTISKMLSGLINSL